MFQDVQVLHSMGTKFEQDPKPFRWPNLKESLGLEMSAKNGRPILKMDVCFSTVKWTVFCPKIGRPILKALNWSCAFWQKSDVLFWKSDVLFLADTSPNQGFLWDLVIRTVSDLAQILHTWSEALVHPETLKHTLKMFTQEPKIKNNLQMN